MESSLVVKTEEGKNLNNNQRKGGKKGKKFKRFQNRKQRKQQQEGRKGNTVDHRKNQVAYEDIVKSNDAFNAYYRMQKLLDTEEEFDQFFAILQHALPSAFRISSFCTGQMETMQQLLQSKFFEVRSLEGKTNQENEDELKNGHKQLPNSFHIAPISWYPNKLAWTLNISKVEIRKTPIFAKLHRFLISETATGDISRQEAVSMIPPLLLDIQPGQSVLDMCAAPGSKTAQLIEMLHRKSNDSFLLDSNGRPQSPSYELDGLVVANDVDNRRCYMLVHQSKRLNSPSVVIINHDASQMPNFYRTEEDGRRVKLKFDRILADVPCSGDGTIRKNYDVWKKWNVANSNNFHHLQLKIAKRGLYFLKSGGLMAYSTCSLNPIEDEAVVAELLRWSQGGLELVDAGKLLPGLITRSGLETWTVMSKEKTIYESYEKVPEHLQSQMRRSLFPPTTEELEWMKLQYCIRVLPHYQNTGGFFITVLRKKVDRFAWETVKEEAAEMTESAVGDVPNEGKKTEAVKPKKPKGGYRGHREDPFFFLKEDNQDWLDIKKYYKLPDTVNSTQLAHRCSKGKSRNLYFFTKAAANFVASNENNIKLITGGARIFSRVDVTKVKCSFRLTQEGIPSICPYIIGKLDEYTSKEVKQDESSFKIVELDLKHFTALLKKEDVKIDDFEENIRKANIETLSHGCVLFYVSLPRPSNVGRFLLPICAWKGKNTVRAYVAKNDRAHLLRLCGEEIDETLGVKEEMKNEGDGNEETMKNEGDGNEEAMKNEGDGNEEAMKNEGDGNEEAMKNEEAIKNEGDDNKEEGDKKRKSDEGDEPAQVEEKEVKKSKKI